MRHEAVATVTFLEIAEAYLSERIVTEAHAKNVRRIASACGTVSVEHVNAYVKARSMIRQSTTVRAERGVLLTLYRWAYETGMIEAAPRGVNRVKARKRPTKAWTIEQVRTLLACAKKRIGRKLKSGADEGWMLVAWILVGYESGARFGDVFSFSPDNIQDDVLAWTQSKTGDPMARPLTPACLEAIDKMLQASPSGRIIGWACRTRQAHRIMRGLIDEAGIGGSSKWLRRSGATHCEMEKAGSGRLHLGHRSPALFESAYCDWAQLRTKTPRTPAIV